jgi:hypothetical protein
MSARLADDAVSIKKIVARGVGEAALRRQFAALPTPRLRKFVFVRRLVLRAAPEKLGAALQSALERLADAAEGETLTFSDFPALVVACARAALSGGASAWHWRPLGVAATFGPGEAVATLLADYPLEAAAAVAALAEAGLLAPVWRDLSEAPAQRLIAALSYATGLSPPDLPSAGPAPARETELARRIAAFWAPARAASPPAAAARRAAAFLALLRFAPGLLRDGASPAAQAALSVFASPPSGGASLASPPPVETPPAAPPRAELASPPQSDDAPDEVGATAAPAPDRQKPAASEPSPAPSPRRPDEEPSGDAPTAAQAAPPAARAAEAEAPRGEAFASHWGGAFFLVNALRRLDIETRLAEFGDAAPSGWRLLKSLAGTFGLPDDEPLSEFFEREDCDTRVPDALRDALLAEMEALYAPLRLWPPPLRQTARILADETHIDVELLGAGVDVELRLAGLDVDPGWTPWLGRVVHFHYPNLPIFIREAL